MATSPLNIITNDPHHTYGFRKCCEAIRDAVPIEEVARRYTDLEPFGGQAWFTGRCPLPDHEDKTPSFYIYPPGRFYCYGCNRHGDVVDLEFFCGDYGELWEAMIALSLEYSVELPKRPESWYRRQERQRPVRDAINRARFDHLRRRLFRWFFEPSLVQIENVDEREAEAALLWDATAPLAEMMLERLRSGGS
jgi:CHC2 zinc finger